MKAQTQQRTRTTKQSVANYNATNKEKANIGLFSFTVTSNNELVTVGQYIKKQKLYLRSYRLEMLTDGSAQSHGFVYVNLPFLSSEYLLDENPEMTTLPLAANLKITLKGTDDTPVIMSQDINNSFQCQLYDGPKYTGSTFQLLSSGDFVSLTMVFEMTGELLEDQEELEGILTLRTRSNDVTLNITNKIPRQILYLDLYRVEMTTPGATINEKVIYIELPWCNGHEHLIDNNKNHFMIPLMLDTNEITDNRLYNVPIYADSDIPDKFTLKVYNKNFTLLSNLVDLAIQFKFKKSVV